MLSISRRLPRLSGFTPLLSALALVTFVQLKLHPVDAQGAIAFVQVNSATPQTNSTTVAVPYTLTLTASGTCWVSVQSDTGQTLYEGTLQPGQQQHVAGGGPLTVRLGNTPAMQISVDGHALTLEGVANTANVRFVPPT